MIENPLQTKLGTEARPGNNLRNEDKDHMVSKSRNLFLFIAVVVLFALGAAAQGPAGGPPGGPGGAPHSGGDTKVVVGKISFKGNAKFSDAELLKAVQLKVGDTMSPDLIKSALNRLITYYRSHGANLSVSPNIDPSGGHATIQFVIDENGTKGDAGLFQPAGGGGAPGGALLPKGPAPIGK
jgi:hypothetical protein